MLPLPRRTALCALALLALAPTLLAQRAQQPWPTPDTSKLPISPYKDDRAVDDPDRISDAITKSVDFLLSRQEDLDAGAKAAPETKAEWPYQGVYRDSSGQIPIGYRIGGTSIAATCLLRAPDYDTDTRRHEAVARAVNFVCTQSKHPFMSVDNYTAGYDVRGWGYTCALAFLLELKAAKAVPAGPVTIVATADTATPAPATAADTAAPATPATIADTVEATIKWNIDAIQRTEIPTVGGWNYARSPGKDTPCPASPFMTGPTLQALFEAKKQGYEVDEAVIKRGLDALERCRCSTGSFVYAADKSAAQGRPEAVPGAIGRMLVGEVTLYLAGRSDQARIRGALDSFLANWAWIEQRRAKPQTHEGPYHIAPYYFYYAHFYAAQAIELLPKTTGDLDRKEYRRRLAQLLFSVQLEDGSWDDRVFPRTANYGTSIAAMSLMMPSAPPLARMTASASPPSTPK